MIKTPDRMTGRQIEVYIHHGELPALPDKREDSRIDDMDAAKRLLNKGSSAARPGDPFLSRLHIPPSAQLLLFIE